jgi:hypothetical protein
MDDDRIQTRLEHQRDTMTREDYYDAIVRALQHEDHQTTSTLSEHQSQSS